MENNSATPELSIVVPCYNEEKNIPLVVKRFMESIGDVSAELILVNNGSKDSSAPLIAQLALENPLIHLVTVETNIGYGFGVWSGLKAARGEFLCWTHADMQTDLADVFGGFQLLKSQTDPHKAFVKGRRGGRPLVDRIFTAGMTVFETVMLGTVLRDINAQPNIFHRNLLEGVSEPPYDFAFDLFWYYTAKKKNYSIVRFPVIFAARQHGQSSWNNGILSKWKFIKRTASFTFSLKKKLRQQQ